VTFTPNDTTNYNNQTATALITVLKATPVVSTTGGTFVYNGSPRLSIGTASVPGTFVYAYTPGGSLAPVNASPTPYMVTATFTPNDTTNYNTATATNTITINKATPTITWGNPADITYGMALGATQLNATASVPGSFVYSPAGGTVLNAGAAQTLSVAFTPTDTTNYNNQAASVLITVLKAQPTVYVTGGSFLLDGQPHFATAVVRGVVGEVITTPAATFVYLPGTPIAPGIYTATAYFAGNANYLPATGSATVVINAPPNVLSVTGPSDPLPVNGSATVVATFDDSATGDTHTCKFTWDDGKPDTTVSLTSTQSSCSAAHTYSAAGVYQVVVLVTDDDGYSDSDSYQYVVVYDPNAGFVTGGGWIMSPAGAYLANPALTGKANFGFVAKYKNGMSVPTGDTEFQFQTADFRFKSTAYDWLVVSGARAQYKGKGTINDAGEYGFLLTAVDGQVTGGGGVDKFRIKIWNIATSAVVYDNVLGASDDLSTDPQAIGGGSIVIHSK
jgi:PKD domain-containing protein